MGKYRNVSAVIISVFLSLIFPGCGIDGNITFNDKPLSGVSVTLNNGSELTSVTDNTGSYRFLNLAEGSYEITPELPGYIFVPSSRSVTLTARGASGQDFRAVSENKVIGQALEFNSPEALIVTSREFEEAFEDYAVLHTLTGIPTEVVSLETICKNGCDDNDPENDTAKAIKDFLMTRDNLKYLILGGDIEVVPSREITDSFSFTFTVPGLQKWTYFYEEIFLSDYYYSDFAEWDLNGNGVYGEGFEYLSDYKPEIAVSRIPVSSISEIDRYYNKLVKYMTDFDPSKMKKVLLQAGVFTFFIDPFEAVMKDVSGAFYDTDPGRTNDILEDFEVTFQYEEADLIPENDAYIYNTPQEFSAAHELFLQDGYSIVRYSNHGDMYTLAPGFYGEDIDTLVNDTFPVILSGICSSGEFGENDAAGERVVNAPDGGAIVFCGQATIGNSLLGSMQLLDEILRYVSTTENPILADSYFYAHDILMEVDDKFYFPLGKTKFPFVFDQTRKVITFQNYGYAQVSSIMLGDFLIPVWNDQFNKAPEIQVIKEALPEGIKLTLVPDKYITRAPMVYADGSYYGFDAVGTSFELTITPAPEKIFVGASSKDTQYYFQEVF